MSQPKPPQSRISRASSRLANRPSHTSPRQLTRLKSLRNKVEVLIPRTPENSKGLSVLNRVIDAEDKSHKEQS